MNTSAALSLIQEDIENSLERVEGYIKEQDSKRRLCAKAGCAYCERIGKVKSTFERTKPLLRGLISSLIADALPRLVIDKHIRPQHGNYQAWILPNGHYVNAWKIGGHSLFHSDCSGADSEKMIKIHSQLISRIIIYDRERPPTGAQIATLRDVYADAVFHGYTEKYRLELSLSYDVHHPNPRFLNEMPF